MTCQLQQYICEQFVGKDKSRESIINEIYKSAKDHWYEKLKYIPLKPMALVTVHKPKSPIIESIGFSEPSDIINNRYGALFAAQLNDGTRSVIISDDGNASRTLKINDPASTPPQFYNEVVSGGVGMRMRVGSNSSASPFLRTDFTLNDLFGTAPESNYFDVTQGGWISGNQQVVCNGLLSSVTTSDTIGESGLFGVWSDTAAVAHSFLMSHDQVSASFNSGENVNVTYTWSIT